MEFEAPRPIFRDLAWTAENWCGKDSKYRYLTFSCRRHDIGPCPTFTTTRRHGALRRGKTLGTTSPVFYNSTIPSSPVSSSCPSAACVGGRACSWGRCSWPCPAPAAAAPPGWGRCRTPSRCSSAGRSPAGWRRAGSWRCCPHPRGWRWQRGPWRRCRGHVVWWSGGLVVWWLGDLMVWWSGGLVILWSLNLVVWWSCGLLIWWSGDQVVL